jgi:protein SCO1/2
MMLLLIFVIVIGILIIEATKDKTGKGLELGGRFLLVDHNDAIFDSKNSNKKKLIYFGYTFCPDVCPFDILKLSRFIDNNPDLKKKLDFIFITVDPDRDQPEQLKSFLGNFNPSIIGLTGSKKQIQEVTKKFRIFVKINKSSFDDENYLVDHSSLFFLVDKNNKYLTHFRPSDFDSKINSLF